MLEQLGTWLEAMGAPGVSVAVDDGRDIRFFGAGVMDLRTKAPVLEQVTFQLGSITKTFTAFLLTEVLAERGIALDTPIVDIAPDIGASNDHAFRSVTVRHLLTHTGGLDSQWWVDVGQGGGARRAAARAIAGLPMTARPGELFSYSNSGYVLAGYLTEVLTGRDWEENVETRIAAHLGPHSISARPEQVLMRPVAAGYAAPPAGGEGARPATRWYAPAALAPGGGLVATPVDVARLMRTVSNRLKSDTAPTIGWRYQGWGLGVARYRLGRNMYCLGHDGTTSGQACAVRLSEGRSGTVVAATNAAWAAPQIGALAEDILREIMGNAADVATESHSDPLAEHEAWRLPANTDVSGRYTRLNATMTVSVVNDAKLYAEERYSPQDALNWFGEETSDKNPPLEYRRVAPYSYRSASRELHFLRHPDNPGYVYAHDGMRVSTRTNRPWS